jgi:hypothetical protein
MRVRVLGLAADGAFAVLETDGRAIEAFGPAGAGGAEAALAAGGIELIGLASGDPQALARRSGVPVAFGFAAEPALKAVYYRARVRMLDLERPAAVVDETQTVFIAENGLLSIGERLEAGAVVRAPDFGPYREAEALAYLAARCWNGLPMAFPGTTGAAWPMPVGRIARPQ